jgi:uncharacterized protein YbjT (DUF2867 family)
MMILIVGGSGVLGRELAGRLLARGEQVRVLTRSPDRARDLERAGAELVEGDLLDRASLARACAGAGAVVAAAHAMLGRGRYRSEAVDDAGNRALIDAARAAGVERFVFVSIYGAAPDHPVDFWRRKYAVEQYLKTSGMTWTILRPSAFMEWHAHVFNGRAILEKGGTTLMGRGTKPRNYVAARDVAAFAVVALTAARLAGRTVDVGGPGDFTADEIAGIYARAAGVTPRVRHVPPAVLRAMSSLAGPFHPGIGRVMYVSSLPDDAFDERLDPAPLLAEFPMELTSMDEFVRERVAESS